MLAHVNRIRDAPIGDRHDDAELLVDQGHDVHTVAGEQLVGEPDPVVAAAAANEQRMIVTTDRGSADVRAYPPGTHSGTVVLHARELRQSVLMMLLGSFVVE
jgi:hypothetical protein